MFSAPLTLVKVISKKDNEYDTAISNLIFGEKKPINSFFSFSCNTLDPKSPLLFSIDLAENSSTKDAPVYLIVTRNPTYLTQTLEKFPSRKSLCEAKATSSSSSSSSSNVSSVSIGSTSSSSSSSSTSAIGSKSSRNSIIVMTDNIDVFRLCARENLNCCALFFNADSTLPKAKLAELILFLHQNPRVLSLTEMSDIQPAIMKQAVSTQLRTHPYFFNNFPKPLISLIESYMDHTPQLFEESILNAILPGITKTLTLKAPDESEADDLTTEIPSPKFR